MTDKEIVDKLIELTDGTIDHFDLDDAMDLLYEVKTILSRREPIRNEQGRCSD